MISADFKTITTNTCFLREEQCMVTEIKGAKALCAYIMRLGPGARWATWAQPGRPGRKASAHCIWILRTNDRRCLSLLSCSLAACSSQCIPKYGFGLLTQTPICQWYVSQKYSTNSKGFPTYN